MADGLKDVVLWQVSHALLAGMWVAGLTVDAGPVR